jgi:DNA-binding transcriptional LysR family regulator
MRVCPPKIEASQSDAVARIGVGSNDKPTGLVNQPVGGQDIGACPHLGGTLIQLGGRYVQLQEQMLQPAHAGFGRENRQDMKPQSGGELKSRQNQYSVSNTPVLVQAALLVGLNSPQSFQ